nr:PREDICTED: carbohydrate sulfotransferase 7 [Anolis carolinensis]|eukprot:XP_008105317.2 PREDICTED: carbohydrate sulfotransferase 7 [Anolis carolinensis]
MALSPFRERSYTARKTQDKPHYLPFASFSFPSPARALCWEGGGGGSFLVQTSPPSESSGEGKQAGGRAGGGFALWLRFSPCVSGLWACSEGGRESGPGISLLLLPCLEVVRGQLSLRGGHGSSSSSGGAWSGRRRDAEAPAVAAPSAAALGAGLGALHAPGAAPGLPRGQGREGGGAGGGGRGSVAARVPALPEPGGGAGRVGLGRGIRGRGGGGQRDCQREPGGGARSLRAAPAVPARDVADGLVVRGRAVQPAPGRLLPVRAHVAPVAGAVPGRRAQPPGRPAGHAGRALPLRLLRPAPLLAAAFLLVLLRQPEHGLALRLAHQQGHLLAAALPQGGASPRVGGPGGRRGLRAPLPAPRAAGPGGRVPQGALVVVKDVRLLDLSALAPLLRDPGLDLRVVQLFRDPRAVHNSRLRAKRALLRESLQVVRSRRGTGLADAFPPRQQQQPRAEALLSGALEVICQGWLRDLRLQRAAPPPLRARLARLRYEDLVRDPRGQLRRLLRFAGLPSPPALEAFALDMTRGRAPAPDAPPAPFLVSARDARHALRAWKERLSRAQVRQVERACAPAMRLLGYPLSREDEAVPLLN